jgi:hypothetical protein
VIRNLATLIRWVLGELEPGGKAVTLHDVKMPLRLWADDHHPRHAPAHRHDAIVRTTIDMTGRRIGRLTVLERAGSDQSHQSDQSLALWRCVCDCGAIIVAVGAHLRRNHAGVTPPEDGRMTADRLHRRAARD